MFRPVRRNISFALNTIDQIKFSALNLKAKP